MFTLLACLALAAAIVGLVVKIRHVASEIDALVSLRDGEDL